MKGIVHALPRWSYKHHVAPIIHEARERQRRRHQRLATLVLIVGLVFAVFGVTRHMFDATASDPSGAALPPSCSLLTNREVAKSLAEHIETRQPTSTGCMWQSVPLGSFTSAKKGLDVGIAHVSRSDFNNGFALARKREHVLPYSEHVLPYRGIGDIAYLEPDGNGSYALSVWQKGVVVQISAWRVDGPLATEKALAAIILRRLYPGV